jgi:hypothetical protein
LRAAIQWAAIVGGFERELAPAGSEEELAVSKAMESVLLAK